ncbi:unnamed protein product [Closterium sp. Yama58-4]|nr:unnamed protein product [Closterium sp. Yama58-4]
MQQLRPRPLPLPYAQPQSQSQSRYASHSQRIDIPSRPVMEKRATFHDSESCDATKSFRKARWQEFQQTAVDKLYSLTWGLAVLVFTSVPGTTCLIGALLLPSTAVLALLGVWLVIEAVFFVFRYKQLQRVSDEYVELPLPSREEISALLDRVLAVAKQADYNDFVGGWFMGASLASLTRTNVRQFISHGFFHRFYNELSSEYQEAVEELVDRAEADLGMHFKDPDAPPPPPPDLLSFGSDSEGESEVGEEERGKSERGAGDERAESESESEATARPRRSVADAAAGGSAICGPLEAAAIAASSRSLGRSWSDAQLPRASGSSADSGKGEEEEAGSGSGEDGKGEDEAGSESGGRRKKKGVDESVRFMAHTRDAPRHHPPARLLRLGPYRRAPHSRRHAHTSPNGIHYWFRAPKKSAPKRKSHKAAAVVPFFDDTSAAGATSAAPTAPLLGASGARVRREEEEEGEEGVVLVHGLGLGLTPYLSFVHMLSRSYPKKKLIVVELAHLAVRLSTSSPTIDDVADGLTDAMAIHGMQSAIFVGHSYGALVLARQVRKRPETVSAMGFVDPACFLLCLPKVLFNFIYKVPGSPSIGDTIAEAVRWFLCGRELQVARALCRGFNWHAYQVWADDIPVHRSVVMLAGQDQIVPSEHIRNYLSNTPVDVMYNDGYHHAQILFSDAKQPAYLPSHFRAMALRRSALFLCLMLLAVVHAASSSVRDDVGAIRIRGQPRSLAQVAPCRASTLGGYTSSVGFNRKGFNLHWKVTSRQSIDIAVEAKTGSGVARGWFAIGWSKSGLMYPADAVIMNFKSDEDDTTPPLGTFALSKHEESGVKPTSRFAITNTEFTSNTSAGVLVRFTRSKFDGIVPVNYNGPNQIIFAYAPYGSQEVKGHAGKRGWILVDFSCKPGSASASGSPAPSSPSKAPSATQTPSPAKSPSPVKSSPKSPKSPPKSPKPSPPPPSPPADVMNPVSTPCKSTSGSSSSSCKASTLAGYTSYVDLNGKGLLLHWKVTSDSSVALAVEAKTGSGAEKGWFGVGWSGSSSMVPSDAVIGNVKGLLPVASYAVSGYSVGQIKVTSRFAIGQPELLTSSDGVIMKFGRSKADGEGIAAVAYKGKNKIIWAYSGSGSRTINDHKNNYGSTTVDFSCKPAPTKC